MTFITGTCQPHLSSVALIELQPHVQRTVNFIERPVNRQPGFQARDSYNTCSTLKINQHTHLNT